MLEICITWAAIGFLAYTYLKLENADYLIVRHFDGSLPAAECDQAWRDHTALRRRFYLSALLVMIICS